MYDDLKRSSQKAAVKC